MTAVGGYLAARREHTRYRAFAAAGYPLGSGCVESANKLVVEARLKGAGMHWARPNVDPMLALRNLLANGRWAEEWPVGGGMAGALVPGPRRRPPAPSTPVRAAAPGHAGPGPGPPAVRTKAGGQRQTHRRPPLAPLVTLPCNSVRYTLDNRRR